MKADKIRSARINKYNRISIVGVSREKIINTLGTVKTKMNFNGITLEHDFPVIHHDVNSKEDVVIGNDLLKKANAMIDYLNKSITVRVIENTPVELPQESNKS